MRSQNPVPVVLKIWALVFLALSRSDGVRIGLLRNYKYDSQCLHPKGSSSDNGAEYELVDCNELDSSQLLQIDGIEGYDSVPGQLALYASGKCLSNNAYGTDNGVHVIQWDCAEQTNQLWKIINGDYGSSFQLQIESSGKCLTAEGSGSYMDQWDCLGTAGAPHQSWTLDVLELPSPQDNYFLLQNVKQASLCLRPVGGSADAFYLELSPCDLYALDQRIISTVVLRNNVDTGYRSYSFTASSKCFDVNGAGTDNGVRIDQYACVDSATNQHWITVNSTDTDSFQLQAEVSGKCLTSEGGGTYVDQWDCLSLDTAPHQFWTYLSPPPPGSPAAGVGLLQNVMYPSQCLHAKDSSNDNGAELELTPCNTLDPGQAMNTLSWQNYASTSGSIFFTGSGKCLSNNAYGTDNGVHVIQWDCAGASNQLWKIVNGNYGDTFQVQVDSSGKCLTAEGGGTYMDQWDCLGTAAAPHQSWKIYNKASTGHDSGNWTGLAVLENLKYTEYCLSLRPDPTADLQISICDESQLGQLFMASAWDDMYSPSVTGAALSRNSGPLMLAGGKCLAVIGSAGDGGTGSDGTRVLLRDCTTNDNSLWRIVQPSNVATDAVRFQNRGSGLCLTAESGGSYMDQWDCEDLNSPHQYWRIRYLTRNPWKDYSTRPYLPVPPAKESYDPRMLSTSKYAGGTWMTCSTTTGFLSSSQGYPGTLNTCGWYCVRMGLNGLSAGYCWSNGYCYCQDNYRYRESTSARCSSATELRADGSGASCHRWCRETYDGSKWPQSFVTGYCSGDGLCVCQNGQITNPVPGFAAYQEFRWPDASAGTNSSLVRART